MIVPRLLWEYLCLGCWKWAEREIDRRNPDAGRVALGIVQRRDNIATLWRTIES